MKSIFYKISIFLFVLVLLFNSFVMPASASGETLSIDSSLSVQLQQLDIYLSGIGLNEYVISNYKSHYTSVYNDGFRYFCILPSINRFSVDTNYPILVYSKNLVWLSGIYKGGLIGYQIYLRYGSGSSYNAHYFCYDGTNFLQSTEFVWSGLNVNEKPLDMINLMYSYLDNYGVFSNFALQFNNSVYGDSNGEFFFPPSDLVTKAMVTRPQMEMATKKILIQVGGLVPLLVGFLVVSISLRKGWIFLRTQLRGA